MTTIEAGAQAPAVPAAGKAYRLYVFALCFALMLLDYMARQVVVSLFPVFKAEWGLTDASLGALVSIVSLSVGVLSIPLAVVADRYSRVKAIAAMAVVWSAATAASALARSYEHLMIARFFVGAGEAAYGAAAASLIASVFPRHQRSTAIGSFMSASMFGSVLGVVTGGAVGSHFGWQAGFWVVGIPGLVLAALFFFLRENPGGGEMVHMPGAGGRPAFVDGVREMFRSRSILAAYAANGVLVFIAGTMTAWLPTFFSRVYQLPLQAASMRAAGAILAAGVGASVCGALVDRVSRNSRRGLFLGPAAIAAAVAVILGTAFRLPPGKLQFALILAGSLGLAGTQGPMCSAIASLVHPGLRATALAVLALVQNIIGLAAGAFVTGLLSDHLGIARALALVPIFAVIPAVLFVAGARSYQREADAAEAFETAPSDALAAAGNS